MYDNHDLEFQRTIGGTTLQTHIVHTYMWMMAGVLVSFVSAFLLVQTGMLFTLFSIPIFFYCIINCAACGCGYVWS